MGCAVWIEGHDETEDAAAKTGGMPGEETAEDEGSCWPLDPPLLDQRAIERQRLVGIEISRSLNVIPSECRWYKTKKPMVPTWRDVNEG